MSSLIDAFTARARIDSGHAAEISDEIEALLQAAVADVLGAAGVDHPDDAASLPDDLQFAITDHAALLYEARASVTTRNRPAGLSLAAARITARYRGVALAAPEAGQDGGDD